MAIMTNYTQVSSVELSEEAIKKKILTNHPFLSVNAKNIFINRINTELYQLLYEGILIREYNIKENRIICFFEEKHIIEFASINSSYYFPLNPPLHYVNE